MDRHPAKRLRASSQDPSLTSEAPTLKLERDDQFWFDDGSIVLVARNVGFRVFRSLLASQSTVFSDMLASSSPSADEVYDGCPVVYLADSPQDLRRFLGVLIPKSRILFYDPDYEFTFPVLSAVIRLSHKYNVASVLQQALQVFTEFDSIVCNIARWPTYAAQFKDEQCAVAVVNIARLTDTLSLLPLAFYECCSLSAAVLDGWKREDGTTEYLSKDDLARCIRGRERLTREAFNMFGRVFTTLAENKCIRPTMCNTALREVARDALAVDSGTELPFDAWFEFVEDLRNPSAQHNVCIVCCQAMIKRLREEREELWEKLPEIFDLEMDIQEQAD